MKGLYLGKADAKGIYTNVNVNVGCIMHFHNKVEFLYILDGHHEAVINGKTYSAEADEIFFVNKFDIHKFNNSPDGGKIILFDFSVDEFKDVKQVFYNKKLPPVLRNKQANREILPLLLDVQDKKLSYLQQASVVDTIMDKFMSTYDVVEEQLIKDENLIREMLLYLNENYSQPFNRDEFAKRFGYNTSYLSHFFKKQVGMGLVEYLRTIRFNKVQELLDRTDGKDKNVLEIVLSCGFDSVSSYYRFARKIKNV
jgi:AraC-like DNA-binding protein/quercetin dioxygenase-like cupin family protein